MRRPHDFPAGDLLEPTGTERAPDGGTVNVRRTACRRCGMVEVTRWTPPDPSSTAQTIIAISTRERPEPGDVPGILERSARITDQEYAAYLAQRGYPSDLPPDRRATATRQTLNLDLRIRAGQLALVGKGDDLSGILPAPAGAESAGTLIQAAPGAVLFWPDLHDGPLDLAVAIDTSDPGPDPSYRHAAELSCRFHGDVQLREVPGRTIDLPPLPAGYADYRLRFHTTGPRALLQAWPHPRTRPRVLPPPHRT